MEATPIYLGRFYSHFSKEQILVLLTEDLKDNSEEVLRRVCNHIGVESDYNFDLAARHNVTTHPTLRLILCRWLGEPSSSHRSGPPGRGGSNFAGFEVASYLAPLLKGLLCRTRPQNTCGRYKPAIEDLERLSGLDLSHWKELM